MIIITSESKAMKLFAKYKSVVAIAMGKSKGVETEDFAISYKRMQSLLPDEDLINAVVKGDCKAKKVIVPCVKALHKPNDENSELCTSMAQVVNIVSTNTKTLSDKEKKKLKKHGPRIVVFVFDDIDKTDKEAKARKKFLTKYLTAMFGEFGITPVADDDVLQHMLKKAKRAKHPKAALVEIVSDFIRDNDKVRISGKGEKLKNLLLTYYGIELTQSGLSALDITKVSDNYRNKLVGTLLDVYTNNNLRVLEGMTKDDMKKTSKRLKKKNEKAVDAYKSFRKIIKVMFSEAKLPKVKAGYKGKKVRMDVKEFGKFYRKNKNAYLITLIYAHTCACMFDYQPGTTEYKKLMTNAIATIDGIQDGFSKAYVTAANEYAKSLVATTEAAK